MSTPETPRTWTLWICNECGLTTASFPPAGLCYSVKPHDNYRMTRVEVVEKALVDAEIERLQRAQEHEIAMRLRVERKHIAAPEHLPTPEEVNRQRERAERGDAERERLLDLLKRTERREASLRGRLKLAADRLEEHDLEHDLDLEAHSERCTGHVHGPCDCGAEP